MEPEEDRIARRRAEINAELDAFDADSAERQTADADPDGAVAVPGKGGGIRSAAFLIGILVAAAGLLGLAVTLNRLAGDDPADAERFGQASVTSCFQHGPITNRGFGYWDSCTAKVVWDDGGLDSVTVDAVFRASEVGRQVRVGDLGDYRARKELVRVDAVRRPWLAWIGYAVGVVALVPALIGTLVLRELFRFRRR